MMETTLVALQDIMLEKFLDEAGRNILFLEFPKIMQQVCFLDLILSTLLIKIAEKGFLDSR